MKNFMTKIWAKQIVMLCCLVTLVIQEAVAQFQLGDVFVAVSNGQVQRRSSAGVLLQTLNTGLGGFTTGMAFDASDNLYVTNFSANSVSKFNSNGVLQGLFGSGYGTPESILFDVAGNAYVGNTSNGIRKYSSTGTFISTSYAGRVDWMDLAADGCTMLRTTEGSSIERHNVCTNSALSAFTTATGGNAFALRIRQNGEVLLANRFNVKRFSAAGALLQTYTVAAENSWFALNLSLDGTSFWSANFNTANVYRIDIATGNVLTSFNTGTGANTVFGLSVFGEYQAAICAANTAPAFVSPTPTCGSTIQANAGSPVSFTVTASDANAADVVNLSATGLPAGATMSPSLPTGGNPVSSAFSWTPTVADAGLHVITFKAADKCVEVPCSITINVVACTPTAVCKNATVTLVNGSASITPADVDGGSTLCGGTITVSPSTFNCTNIGNNNVTLTITDLNNVTYTCNAVVTVVGAVPSCSITAIPDNNIYTGGVPTNIYLGYGPQSVTLNSSASGGAPFTYSWSPATGLSNSTIANPVFTPTAAGSYTFTLTVTNSYGCTSTCTITICVLDIRMPGTDGKKVYLCHAPPDNPGNTQQLSISVNAVPSHLQNHALDHLGKCTDVPCGTNAPVTNSITSATKISILPNPNNGQFTLKLNNLKGLRVEVLVVDASGITIESRVVQLNTNGNILQFNLRNKIPGRYYVKVISQEGVFSEKIVIQR